MSADQPLAVAPHRVTDLIDVIQRLSQARDVATVQDIVRTAARRLTGADGATFVLCDGDQCHYVDEDAIGPLWKGQRFPMSASVSGWAMMNRRTAVIDDVFADPRVPDQGYRATFVKSMVMVPVRVADPLGAIGTYWATQRHPTDEEVRVLEALAGTTAVALENVRVFTELEARVKARTAELVAANAQLVAANANLTAAHQQADRVFAAYAKVLPGTVLDGKYRLDEELGAGGFGVVFRARHLALDCPIAVKVFRPISGNDSALELQRFLREGATAARISHPNVVRVLDSGVSSGGIAFLAMELLSGRSLARELAAVGALSLRRAATVAAVVADVLNAAHRQSIVHRDIKPDNVFLHYDTAGREVVKVVDFGIAKFFDGPQSTDDRLTRTGEYLGTPRFVAPERVRGGTDDGRSDVYSLGTLLYELVCGASPWAPEQEREIAAGLAFAPHPRPISRFRKAVPVELSALIERALAWNPIDRPTAQELASALAALAPTLDDTPPRPEPAPPRDPDATDALPVVTWPR
ncbi:protein kinase [Gemmata sp. G18]|uniref:Protein kinase n=1 Tax=Gemmata palustris TaxID=2822762 RepID=A0ABS5BJ05_9BACT|nr:protein kinase [Gemmata palustris]MBP3953694.1 protein kinase [Gemmata palustris]